MLANRIKFTLVGLIICAASICGNCAFAAQSEVSFSGTLEESDAKASPNLASVTLRVIGDMVLQNLYYGNCRPSDLHFWQSCRDRMIPFGAVYLFNSRLPTTNEMTEIGLSDKATVLDLEDTESNKVIGHLYITDAQSQPGYGILKIANPLRPGQILTITLRPQEK